jgi:secondary thiamine-phosphate synthase enzyme
MESMRVTSRRLHRLTLLAAFVAPAALAMRLPAPRVSCIQTTMSFTAPQRGYHLITDEINEILGSQLEQFQCGMCNLFVQHMTNSLTLNENSDPSVRAFESLLTDDEAKLAVDVPSKPDALAMSLDIPIKGGMLALGPWQGIYLCEHSESGLPRDAIIVITAHGALAQTVSKVGLETPPQLSSCSIYTRLTLDGRPRILLVPVAIDPRPGQELPHVQEADRSEEAWYQSTA